MIRLLEFMENHQLKYLNVNTVMKRSIILIMVCSLLTTNASYARGGRFWKALKGALCDAVESATAVVVQKGIESAGYTHEEAQKHTRDIYEAFGRDQQNVERGLSFVDAENKYERQNVVKDLAFDFAADVSDNHAFVESMRKMTDNTFSYLDERTKVKTAEERQYVIDTHIRNLSDIMYDTYEEAKELKAQRLSEKLQLAKQLESRGQSPELAIEMAAQIIIVSNDKNLTVEEKENYYRAYGLYDDVQQIGNLVENVSNIDYEQEKQQLLLAQQEEERKMQEKNLKKQEEERSKAISAINTALVECYAFDQDALSDSQKQQLDRIAESLLKYKDLNIELLGHTCNKGYKSVNNRIGLRRAETVKAYLVERGIDENRITTSSKGENEPKILQPTLEERKQNRRVEFIVK